MEKRARIEEINLMRAFSILAVLIIHGTSLAVVNLTQSHYYFFYLFLNKFSSFTVPTFIFISGFVLFYNYYPKECTSKLIMQFYQKRIQFILIPYMVFTLLYEFYYLYIVEIRTNKESWNWFIDHPIFIIKQMLHQILTNGGTFYHLYFMFIIVQFYLLFPIFLRLLKQPIVAKFSILAACVVQWTFYFLNEHYGWIQNPSIYFLNYISYFFVGAYIGIYFEKIKNWIYPNQKNIKRYYFFWVVWILSGILYVCVNDQLLMNGIKIPSTVINVIWFLFCNISFFALFQISNVLYQNASKFIVNPLIHFGVYSFAIYFIHPFLLALYQKWIPVSGISMDYQFYIIKTLLLTLFTSWVISLIIATYLPYSWILFGSIPKKISYKDNNNNDGKKNKKTEKEV